MSTSGSKSNEHMAHFLVDIHMLRMHQEKIVALGSCFELFYLLKFKLFCGILVSRGKPLKTAKFHG